MAKLNPYSPVPKDCRDSALFSEWAGYGAEIVDYQGISAIFLATHTEESSPLPADYDYRKEWNASRDYFRDVKPEDAPLPTKELLGCEAGSAEILLPARWDDIMAQAKAESREMQTAANKLTPGADLVGLDWGWPEPSTPACRCWRCAAAMDAERAMLGR